MSNRVTWLLPVKNGMPFLPETLASIEAQTYRDWEILAWDNGSTDGTLEELQRWIPSRLPGRIITGQPLGLADSLAALVMQAPTELCARIDADDVNVPNRLELQVEFLSQHPEVSLVGGQMNKIDEGGNDHGSFFPIPLHHEDIVHFMLYANGISHPTVLFRRHAILEAGNYQNVGAVNVEDYDLWLRVATRGRVANLKDQLLFYRVHSKSTTQMSLANDRLTDAMNQRFYEHGPNLYGCTLEEAKKLRTHGNFNSKKILLKIVKHLNDNQKAPIGVPIYQNSIERLKSKSFITSAQNLTSREEWTTQIWLMWLSNGISSAPGILPFVAKAALRQLGVRELVHKMRARKHRKTEKARRAIWLQKQAANQTTVDPSVLFTGMDPRYEVVSIGKNCVLEPDVTIWISPDEGAQLHLTVEDSVSIGRNTYIGVYQPISIGKFTMIGAYCYLISANHCFERRDLPIKKQGFTGASIVIEEDVWLGTHVVVLPGVTIGQGAIIAAGSIVNKNVPPYEIWGGVPARFIKNRP